MEERSPKSFARRLAGIIVRPVATSEEIVEDPQMWRGILVLVSGVALPVLLMTYFASAKINYSSELMIPVPEIPLPFLALQWSITPLFSVGMMIAVLWVCGRLFKEDEGQTSSLLAVVGYSFVIFVVGFLFLVPVFVLHPRVDWSVTEMSGASASLSNVSMQGVFFGLYSPEANASITAPEMNTSITTASTVTSDTLNVTQGLAILVNASLKQVVVGDHLRLPQVNVSRIELKHMQMEEFDMIYVWVEADPENEEEVSSHWSFQLLSNYLGWIRLALWLWVIALNSMALQKIYAVSNLKVIASAAITAIAMFFLGFLA